MDDPVFPEVVPEKRRWMFWLAKIFGKKCDSDGCFYFWRGKLWAMKDKISDVGASE